MSLKSYIQKIPNDITALTLIGPLLNDDNIISRPVVFVDGGVKFRQNGIGYSVGDGDSTIESLDELLDKEKDQSDLSYALISISSNRFKTLLLRGFLGGRRDHELINLGEAHLFLKKQTISTKIKFDDKVLLLSQGAWEVNINGIFSVFTFEKTNVAIGGNCKYKTKYALFPYLSSNGLSNVGNGEVHFKCDSPIVIFFNF